MPRGNPNAVAPDRALYPYPRLRCVSCGKTKLATRFPKRGGPTHEKLKPTDPRRYDKQCKLCKKPTPANAPADYVHKEPILAAYAGKRKKPKQRTRRTADEERFVRAETKRRRCSETRIKSMQYTSGKGCHKCGERDPRKLEYDHKDPTNKNAGISRLITAGYPWSSPVLRAEIRKCRILCANCHRLHTVKQQGYFATDNVQRNLGELAAKHGFEL